MLLNQNTLNLYGEKLFEQARVTPTRPRLHRGRNGKQHPPGEAGLYCGVSM